MLIESSKIVTFFFNFGKDTNAFANYSRQWTKLSYVAKLKNSVKLKTASVYNQM